MSSGFPTRSDTNQTALPQNMARDLRLYCICSEYNRAIHIEYKPCYKKTYLGGFLLVSTQPKQRCHRDITKTRPCNTQQFYGCKNVRFQMKFFNTFAKNIDCWYTLEPPQ